MEQIAIFEEKVALTPADLSREITSFDEILLERLKKTLEGKCSRHGFVIPGSLELLSRSMGSAEKGRFTADFLYYLKAQGKVYNPPDGFQIEGEVIRKNKMGLYVIIENAVRIMIPRDLHIGNVEFDQGKEGDEIEVEVVGARFQQGDTSIVVLGKLRSVIEPDKRPVEAEEEGVGLGPQIAAPIPGAPDDVVRKVGVDVAAAKPEGGGRARKRLNPSNPTVPANESGAKGAH